MSATGTAPELLYVEEDGVGLVTFNRPAVRNALTFGMYERLAEICESTRKGGSVKALVISGAGGKAFAAGTDISLFRDFKGAEESLQRILDRDPNNATALNNFGYFLAERGERLEDALSMSSALSSTWCRATWACAASAMR